MGRKGGKQKEVERMKGRRKWGGKEMDGRKWKGKKGKGEGEKQSFCAVINFAEKCPASFILAIHLFSCRLLFCVILCAVL